MRLTTRIRRQLAQEIQHTKIWKTQRRRDMVTRTAKTGKTHRHRPSRPLLLVPGLSPPLPTTMMYQCVPDNNNFLQVLGVCTPSSHKDRSQWAALVPAHADVGSEEADNVGTDEVGELGEGVGQAEAVNAGAEIEAEQRHSPDLELELAHPEELTPLPAPTQVLTGYIIGVDEGGVAQSKNRINLLASLSLPTSIVRREELHLQTDQYADTQGLQTALHALQDVVDREVEVCMFGVGARREAGFEDGEYNVAVELEKSWNGNGKRRRRLAEDESQEEGGIDDLGEPRRSGEFSVEDPPRSRFKRARIE
ncbi:hypothetical protein GALMADRAFT_1358836 [Galerina marginata CBS 339.88]|uniref:Uncharacterized protein n=1 Tax=Galerina marginata (strain CBS 339.88) TaxID=685588 RepID=A0A067S8L8_GALM3|nr:hypothetical protein GALMADRAFT_1358836 [Galerina marginata CBS 339.88]